MIQPQLLCMSKQSFCLHKLFCKYMYFRDIEAHNIWILILGFGLVTKKNDIRTAHEK